MGVERLIMEVQVYTGRSSSFGLMLKLVAKYPFVREIIVWNDDPTVDLGTKVRSSFHLYRSREWH